jgi:hypothetical protein
MNIICKYCGEEKPLEEFGRLLLGKYGRRGHCNKCHRKVANEYYKKNSTHINAQRRFRKQKIKT